MVGYGRAEKPQVGQMVKLLLGLDAIPTPHDAADALAVAICHLHIRQRPDIAPEGAVVQSGVRQPAPEPRLKYLAATTGARSGPRA